LRKKIAWSDGQAITAQDFVRAFQELLDPQNHAFRADLLYSIENAKKVNAGKALKTELRVSAPKTDVLEIRLENPDSEFLYSLTSPLLAPLPPTPLPSVEDLRKNPSLWKSSGAYILSSWQAQKKITLKPNAAFWKKNQRPEIEVLTVSEDSVALNLYEKSELSFLRRLPTLFIPKYKGRPDFFEIEQIRFDYIGFSEKWKSSPDLRLSLAQSLRYTDLQNLFQSRGVPGCVGIPESLHTEKICHPFSLEKAKSLWAALPEKPKSLELLYSKQGGDDHKRSMEWLQAEWKKNLGLDLNLNGIENKIFIERLENNPADLFRKGLAPERPTCLSALENFETGNSENYIHYSSKEFDQILSKMRESQKEEQKKKLCDRALHLLMDLAWIIPTGPIHFTLLAQPQWQGWKLNELNQLDLSELHWSEGNKKHP
jgi:oligopeptide transport system substrate-binding protein